MTAQPLLISQKTPDEKLIDIILSNEREFLVSESVERQLELMRTTRDLFFHYGSRIKVVSKLVKHYHLPERTAWKLVEITPRLFKVLYQNITPEFHVDIHLQKIEETYQLAKSLEDVAGMNGANKLRADAIKDFFGTANRLKPEDLVLPPVEAAFHPEWYPETPQPGTDELDSIMGAFRKKQGIIRKMTFQDIDFEIVNEDDNAES